LSQPHFAAPEPNADGLPPGGYSIDFESFLTIGR
jgi:hypothetical protein